MWEENEFSAVGIARGKVMLVRIPLEVGNAAVPVVTGRHSGKRMNGLNFPDKAFKHSRAARSRQRSGRRDLRPALANGFPSRAYKVKDF